MRCTPWPEKSYETRVTKKNIPSLFFIFLATSDVFLPAESTLPNPDHAALQYPHPCCYRHYAWNVRARKFRHQFPGIVCGVWPQTYWSKNVQVPVTEAGSRFVHSNADRTFSMAPGKFSSETLAPFGVVMSLRGSFRGRGGGIVIAIPFARWGGQRRLDKHDRHSVLFGWHGLVTAEWKQSKAWIVSWYIYCTLMTDVLRFHKVSIARLCWVHCTGVIGVLIVRQGRRSPGDFYTANIRVKMYVCMYVWCQLQLFNENLTSHILHRKIKSNTLIVLIQRLLQ